MPLHFTEAQVRSHLKELGYDQVSDVQLKEFIRDLKKLIRHEEKRERLQESTKREPQNAIPDVRIQIEEEEVDDSGISEVGDERDEVPFVQANRPTTSFIRPRLQDRRRKTDPIQLYQDYKAYWDSIHFPGDDSSKSLRWVIREKMMGPQ